MFITLEKANSEQEMLRRMNSLRGLLALAVVLSHVWGYCGAIWLVPFNKVVPIVVAFFFFLSGYGMTFVKLEGKVNTFLCDISAEIYFYHIPLLLFLSNGKDHPLPYLLVCVTSTIMAASAVHFFNSLLFQRHSAKLSYRKR